MIYRQNSPPLYQPQGVSPGCYMHRLTVVRTGANAHRLMGSDRYKEIEYEEVEYDPPLVILDKLDALEKEIAGDLKELWEMVS